MFTPLLLRAVKSGNHLTGKIKKNGHIRLRYLLVVTIVFTNLNKDREKVYLIKKSEENIKC